MKRFSVWDIIISVTALAVVCAAVVPAVARLQRTPEDAKCQGNMRRWAGAIELYTSDWDGRYPTNRIKPGMMMAVQATLSPDNMVDQYTFVYSINWVEALYSYIKADAQKTGRDWRSFRQCPNAGPAKYPITSKTACMTYSFNYNLLEQPIAFSRNRQKLMMMREMDRLVDAVCRPANNTTNNSSAVPMSPFLSTVDYYIRTTPPALNPNMHGQGSHILFADGHVAYFSADYYPNLLARSSQWDMETSQWWNWVNTKTALDKTIAITP